MPIFHKYYQPYSVICINANGLILMSTAGQSHLHPFRYEVAGTINLLHANLNTSQNESSLYTCRILCCVQFNLKGIQTSSEKMISFK